LSWARGRRSVVTPSPSGAWRACPPSSRPDHLPEDARHALRARLEEAVRLYQTPTGLDLPKVA
jgi:hypothetical protein